MKKNRDKNRQNKATDVVAGTLYSFLVDDSVKGVQSLIKDIRQTSTNALETSSCDKNKRKFD